jgi:hypothetical protein
MDLNMNSKLSNAPAGVFHFTAREHLLQYRSSSSQLKPDEKSARRPPALSGLDQVLGYERERLRRRAVKG